MTYIPVHISHRGNSDWEAHIPFYDGFSNEFYKNWW